MVARPAVLCDGPRAVAPAFTIARYPFDRSQADPPAEHESEIFGRGTTGQAISGSARQAESVPNDHRVVRLGRCQVRFTLASALQ